MVKSKMKKLAAGLLAALLISSLAACNTGNTPASSSGGDTAGSAESTPAASTEDGETAPASDGGDVKLRIAWWGNQLRNDTTMAMLDAYTEENPNITFEAEFSDWSGYWDKAATQAASNSLPDIFQHDYAYIEQYYVKGQLANLSTLVDGGYLNLDDVAASTLSSGMFDGQLYALVSGVNAVSTAYNSRVLEEAGVTLPERLTYSDVFSISEQVFEATGVRGNIPAGEWAINMRAREKGEAIYKDGQIGMSVETAEEYFQAIYDAINSPWSVSVDIIQDNVTSGLESNALAMGHSWVGFHGSNQVAAIQAATEDQLEIVLWPRIDDYQMESMYLRPAMFWTIMESSEYKEEAAKVIDYYTNNERAQDLLQAERGVPISTKMADYMLDSLDDVTRQHFDYIATVTDVAVDGFPPYPNGSNEVLRLLDDLTDLVRYGEVTPADAASRWVSESNDILTRAAE